MKSSKYEKINEEDFFFFKAVLEKTNYSFMVDDLNRELFASKINSEEKYLIFFLH
ncbi:hypothetical protein [Winogradskyella tangerina]|uniref:hypothetical protein n=1 Tax=Winogradskyella tangerina TaxID=2023240 RepID=UPI0013003DC1|nr:hypothetical protein [Winogradskyella tangerina]